MTFIYSAYQNMIWKLIFKMINSFDIGIHSDLAILAAILFLCKFMQIRG